jgi:hypothetical protein
VPSPTLNKGFSTFPEGGRCSKGHNIHFFFVGVNIKIKILGKNLKIDLKIFDNFFNKIDFLHLQAKTN